MSGITNYSFCIGRDLVSPFDLPRVWMPVATNQTIAMGTASEDIDSSNAFSISLCKYYLNNIVAITVADTFGAQAHYTSLVAILSNLEIYTDHALNSVVTNLNSYSKYSIVNTTKYDTMTASITTMKANFLSLYNSCDTLKTAVTATRTGLVLNYPTTNSYNAARANYATVINGLGFMMTRLQQVQTVFDQIALPYNNGKEATIEYLDPEGIQDIPTYLTYLNLGMTNLLTYSAILYQKLGLYRRLRGD